MSADESEALRARVRAFVTSTVIPFEQEAVADRVTGDLRIKLQELARAAGVFALQAPFDFGGGGADFLTTALLLEEAGYSLLGAARRTHDIALRHASTREVGGARLGTLGLARQLIADNEYDLGPARLPSRLCCVTSRPPAPSTRIMRWPPPTPIGPKQATAARWPASRVRSSR